MSEKAPARIETWDPFREFDLFRGWPALSRPRAASELALSTAQRWAPSMDVSETKTHFIATLELAGAKKEDVHVEVEDGVLTIRGEKRSEREEEHEERRYTERSFGTFSRSFTLPSNTNDEDIKATFTEGVLRVEIAKQDEPKAKSIQVR